MTELSYFATDSQSVSPSILALSPSVTLDQILAEVIQVRGWSRGASSLTGVRVCLYLTLYWCLLLWVSLSLRYLQLSQSVSPSVLALKPSYFVYVDI